MDTPQMPALFLSHAGAQKGFTWSLYRELLHVNHNPFFDQDARDHSLPKGEPFPSRIVEACRACKLGIVVVSHEYIESLWPMLELIQFLFHNPSSPNNVYPVFYKLKPADLSNQENLAKWQRTWEIQAPSWHAKLQDLHMAASNTSTSNVQLTLDISSWPKALEMLRSQSGEILPDNKDEHAFIQTIVRHICYRLPPPESFLMGDHFKGAEHIQQEIHELFQQQERIVDTRKMPIAVGVYGVGGSGKTTMCKYMLSFYNKEYPGSCCFLQFPSQEEDESQLLLKSRKEVLAKRGNRAKESLDKINSVEQAMPHLQEMLKRYKLFLILDNVWDWALPSAQQIMTMHYVPGSRLLVTARSQRLLQTLSSSIRIHDNEVVGRLPAMQIVHVPSISIKEAVEALMVYSLTSSQYNVSITEDLWGLARSCFFGEQCHPLLLKAVGAKLRHLGGHTRNARDWIQRINLHLQAHGIHDDGEIEDMVLNVLKTSFHALHPKLKDTFLNLGTCVPKGSFWYGKYEYLSSASEWLSMLSHNGYHSREDIRDQLVELEYHGLIQIQKEKIVIHDLQMMLIEKIVEENNDVPRCYFFEGDVGTVLSTRDQGTRIKYIRGPFLEEVTDLTVLRPERICGRPNWPNIEVLCSEFHVSWQRLSVQHMRSLRYLELKWVHMLKELRGWHGAPNLVSVKLVCCKHLEKIESMACLRRLETLVIENCMRSGQYVTNLSSCENLKRLVIRDNGNLKTLVSLGHLPKLQELDLSMCRNLVDVGALIPHFPSLQSCKLTSTGILKFPNFNSSSLRVLDLPDCRSLQSIEGSVCGLTALEELNVRECRELESIPDLKPLVKLRRLRLQGVCHALKEVKLGDAALTSLERLELPNSCRLMRSTSVSPCPIFLPFSAFTKLRFLCGMGEVINQLPVSVETLDVMNVSSLEFLILDSLETEESTLGLSALVNLKCLFVADCPRFLTKITDLGSLTKLKELFIWKCDSLREVGDWEAPFISNLEKVDISFCPNLETLSTMRHLTSLKRFSIVDCPMVQKETLPLGLESFGDSDEVLWKLTIFRNIESGGDSD